MAPLIILLATFAALYWIDRFALKGRLGLSFVGRAAMAVMLIATGISHFTNTEEMIAMMPDFTPAKRELVFFTGICELAAVPGLLWSKTSRLASILLLIFFVLVLPANIAGSLKQVQFGGMEYGSWYLVFRIPLQALFIWWVWYFGVRTGAVGVPPPRLREAGETPAAHPMQKLQDWFTQQWVIIRGRRIDPKDVPWLNGPFGKVGGIGGAFIDQLAEKEGLIVKRNVEAGGLISSIGDLNLTEPELARLSKLVIDFYENTANYALSLSIAWNPLFRILGVLTNKLFSHRINQLNIPTVNFDDAETLKSEIVCLVEPLSNETRHTIWFRTIESSGQVVYSGVYGTCRLPSGKTCIKAAFPLPYGNATVIMIPSVGADGELILESSGKEFGDAGFYFLLEDSGGGKWSQFIRSFRDRLTIRVENDHLLAEQSLTLWNYQVVRFNYRIVLSDS